jgi:hypothetical protein
MQYPKADYTGLDLSKATMTDVAARVITSPHYNAEDIDDERTAVSALAKTYPDALISLTDTLVEAQTKLLNSKIYQNKIQLDENKLLSPSEAATLAVPYGTTRKQAAAMGITPERWKGKGGKGLEEGNLIIKTPDGKQYDIGTVAGLKQLKAENPDYTYADLYSFMDENTKLTTGAIKNLLIEAGYKETETKQIPTKEAFIQVFQQYKNAGWLKEETTRQFMSENKIDLEENLSSVVKEALLETFASPEEQQWRQKALANPNKYKIVEGEGIYEIKKWWPNKLVYSFE